MLQKAPSHTMPTAKLMVVFSAKAPYLERFRERQCGRLPASCAASGSSPQKPQVTSRFLSLSMQDAQAFISAKSIKVTQQPKLVFLPGEAAAGPSSATGPAAAAAAAALPSAGVSPASHTAPVAPAAAVMAAVGGGSSWWWRRRWQRQRLSRWQPVQSHCTSTSGNGSSWWWWQQQRWWWWQQQRHL